jgi:RNA polymerase sigma-70 factor (ECF subfamily)
VCQRVKDDSLVMTKVKDDDIISRLNDINTRNKAFEDLVNKYSQTLYWQIRRIVIFHDDADDVLQNTFIKAWGGIGAFRNDCKLSTWLYRIALNESLTFLNKKKTQGDLSGEEVADLLESDAYFDGDEVQAMLQAAVASLPNKQRIVFNLKYFQEMKYEEMSELLGTSVGALKASFHHAVRKIEEYISSKEL